RPIIASLSGFKFRTLTLLESTVVIETGEGDPETVSVHNVEIAPSGHGLISAKGRLEVRGETLDIDVAFAQPSESAADAPIQLRVAVKGDNLAASFNSRLATGDHWQVTAENAELSVANLRSFASWVGA